MTHIEALTGIQGTTVLKPSAPGYATGPVVVNRPALVKDCHCRLDPSLGQPTTAPSLPASVLNQPGRHRQML
jgi:hypothetical protein